MNILCVDDDADFLDLTTAFLQRKLPDATLYTATRTREAFDLLESEPIHCIVSDYEMPDQTGLEFLNAVREEYPELPFILFTGKGSEEIASRAISAGVTDYLRKRGPEQHNRLATRIENAGGNARGVTDIGRARSERETREHQLEALNHTVEQLLSADTPEEIAELGVSAAREVLGLKANAIHFYDDDVGGLVPVAHTETLVELIGQPPTLMPGESTAWRVYDSGVATAIDDVRDDPDVYDSETSIRSELYVPLGEYGILIAGSQTGSRFDERDVTVGELLASHLVSALEQLEHEQQLRDRESELERQNERLDQFSSMVSHDLHNPVSIANGYLELYRESGDEADLEAVEQALERVEELITDLTTIARHGSTDEERERVSLPALAEDAWAMVDTRSATLVADECTVTADRSQLQGLFENLFRNAVGHGGADVTVRVGPLEDGFYVEDTGSGIPPDERELVFEQGYSTGYSGSGVGLTIVTRIAQAHGWRVSLTESDECGARFEFRDADGSDEAER